MGYRMSYDQLNEIWHYDMRLAHEFMGLPLRACKARPREGAHLFHAMDPDKFEELKKQIYEMWKATSLLLQGRKGNYGWGLCFSDNFEKYSK